MKGSNRAILVTLFAVVSVDSVSEKVAAGTRVFIPLGSGGSILVIDADTDEVLGEIVGFPAVHGLAGTPDGQLLVTGSYEEFPLEQAVESDFNGMSSEDHEAHHTTPSDSTAAGNQLFSTVTILRSASGEIVGKVNVPGAVHHVAVSPDGSIAAVTHPLGDRISAIDLATAQVIAVIETGLLPNYLVFSADGGSLFVTNAGSDLVAEVSTAMWEVVREIAVGEGPEHVVLSPDGALLYVNNVNGGTVSVVDVKAWEVVTTYQFGSVPHGIDLSDDGSTLFVVVLGEDSLVAIDLQTGHQRGATFGPEPYHLAAIHGLNKLYLSSAGSPFVWVINQQTLSPIHQIDIGGKGYPMFEAPED